VFKQNQGNILVTAEALGIARDTLKRKLDKFGLRIYKS
jgi:DNA-binding protein Fis